MKKQSKKELKRSKKSKARVKRLKSFNKQILKKES